MTAVLQKMIILDPAIARAARAYTRLGQEELAKEAGVATRTVYKIEQDGNVTRESRGRIIEALRRFGVTMLYDDGGVIDGIRFRPKSVRGN